MTDEDRALESFARQIADAITGPFKRPDSAAVERIRQDAIASLRRDPDVVSAEADPNDPCAVTVVAKSPAPVSRIAIAVRDAMEASR